MARQFAWKFRNGLGLGGFKHEMLQSDIYASTFFHPIALHPFVQIRSTICRLWLKHSLVFPSSEDDFRHHQAQRFLYWENSTKVLVLWIQEGSG